MGVGWSLPSSTLTSIEGVVSLMTDSVDDVSTKIKRNWGAVSLVSKAEAEAPVVPATAEVEDNSMMSVSHEAGNFDSSAAKTAVNSKRREREMIRRRHVMAGTGNGSAKWRHEVTSLAIGGVS